MQDQLAQLQAVIENGTTDEERTHGIMLGWGLDVYTTAQGDAGEANRAQELITSSGLLERPDVIELIKSITGYTEHEVPVGEGSELIAGGDTDATGNEADPYSEILEAILPSDATIIPMDVFQNWIEEVRKHTHEETGGNDHAEGHGDM